MSSRDHRSPTRPADRVPTPALRRAGGGVIAIPGLDALDGAVGGALEHAVRRHHRRRLTKLGHGEVFDPSGPDLWVPGGPAPRPGNAVDVLVDGNEALPVLSEALLTARSHVHIAGWHLAPGFRLQRDDGAPTVAELLQRLGERVEVRVLLWAGPPVPVFQPSRPSVESVRDELTATGTVRCVLDARERTLHCHHEKIVVVDDEIAFVGGIDLTDLAGDRWDERHHPPRGSIGWHDSATRLRGPIVADVARHFRDRWQEVAHEPLPAPVEQPRAGEVTLQFLRTVPERTYDFAPAGEFRILDAYLRALRSAERLIYLENQFLWSAEIVQVLLDKILNPPHPDFRMVLLLPARPSNGADTTRGQLGCLVDADDGAGRLLAVTLVNRDPDEDAAPYIHAKIGIVDDRWLTIGSANLNEHSLFNDTEANVVTTDPDLARNTRIRLWAEHLGLPADDIAGDPTKVIDTLWAERADREPEPSGTAGTRISRLPAVSRRSERLVGPLRGLLVDG